MPTLDELRTQVPQLNGLDDTHAVLYLQRRYYPDRRPEELAQRLGVKVAAAPEEQTGLFRRIAQDVSTAALKTSIAVPEALVGMADIATGGRAGKLVQDAGIDFKRAQEIASGFYSPETQAAQRAVEAEQGFLPKLGAAVKNPSVIATSVGESVGPMLAGGALARGVLAVAPRIGAMGAAGIGEGAISAGSTAEQIRQQTADGLLTPVQSGVAAVSGAATGLLGALGGKIAQRMGIADVDTLIAGGAGSATTKGFVRRVLEGAASEGLLEELPQSIQEQVAQNYALGKPLDEGVDQAAVLGMLAGGMMGGAAQAFHGKPAATGPGDAIRATELVPETGPITRATNAGTEVRAAVADVAGVDPAQPAPEPPLDDPMQDRIRALPAGAREEAVRAYAVVNRPNVAKGVLQYNRKLLDRLLADNEPSPAEPGAAGAAEPPAAALPDAVAPGVAPGADPALMPEARGVAAPDADGVIPPPAAAPVQPPLIDPVAQREADRPPEPTEPVQPTDVLNSQGKPFTTMPGAMRAMKGREATHDIVRVVGGLVLRPKPGAAPADAAGPVPADSGRAAPAPAPAAPPAPELDMGQPPAPRTVTVNEKTVALTPEQAAEWDRVGAEFKEKFDQAQATFERTRRAPRDPNADPDIGARTAQEQLDATRKRLGMELSAARRRIAGALTPKEQAAADADAARVRPGDTVKTPQGTGTVVANVFGKVKVQIGDQAVMVPRGDVTKTTEVLDAPVQPPRTDAPTPSPAAPTAQAPAPAGAAAAPAAGVPGTGTAPALETPGVAGKPIDAEWTAFAPETGTKGVPRADMPQVKAEHRGALTQFLKGRGITHQQEAEVEPGTLKPTQAEFSPEKVRAAREFSGGDRAILVSSDGHVVDGHHQWAAALDDGKPIRVIRLDAPIDELLPVVKEFPSAEAAPGATAASGAVMPAGLRVTFGGKTYPVESIKDAQRKWEAFRDQTGAGVSSIGNGVRVTDGAGRFVARISYNGRAWDTEDDGAGGGRVIAEAPGATAVSSIAPAPEPALAEAPAPAPAAPASAPEPTRLTDAGEELIRNRRGKLKGLAWDDVSAMNDTLKVAQVVKSNVWPRPDYAKMVEEGAAPWKAAVLKAVYDKLAAAPVTRTTPTDADLKAYIETLAKIRETLLAELDRVEKLGGAGDLWKTLRPDNVFGKVFPMPEGERVSTFGGRTEQGKENNRRALLIGGNGPVQALQFSSRTLMKVRDLLADGFPAKQEAWQKSYEVRATETRDSDVPGAERTGQPQQRFYVYEKGSRYRLAKGGQDGGYATQEQAEAFARTLTARKRETLPPSRGLDLSDVKRTGPDWRGGKDVTADQVMQHFGFRGVNLGEYVKAKQHIAQLHLNHVFDAFSDLADLLGVPPKAMSLNGTLGVAIGAQGSGKALAHFVPGVNEINITRDSGAGALAHEFGHAVDHYFATQHGRAASMAKRPYLSAVVENVREPGGVRPEVLDAMRAVMKAINQRLMTEAEARKYLEDQRALNQRRMDRWIAEFKGNKGADPEALAAVGEKLKRGDLGEPQDADVETNLSEFMRAAGLKPGNAIAANAFTTAYRLRDLADEARFMASHIPQVDTDYARASAAMDAKKAGGEGYWSTPWEKFARAFETFAMDALKDRERESLYLSGLVDSSSWRTWSEETGKATPYPAGAERLEMQQAFQKLVDTIQTREDDAGNVAMFSRSEADPTTDPDAIDGYVPQAVLVRRLARDIAKAWPNGPDIVVAIDMGDPAIPEVVRRYDSQQQSRGATGSIEGLFFGGKVYLIADQIATRKDAQRVLFHEVLGHYGLAGAFPGAGLETILDRMAVLQASKVRAKAKAYGLDMEKVRERRMAAEEVLAELAQQNPQLGWVQKAVAAIRTWLRERVPGFGQMQFSDDELVKSFILPARGFVERGRGAAVGGAVPAFSRSSALGDALTSAANNVRDVRLPAGYVVADLFDSSGTMSWWHKSVGTMFDLAQRNPSFKKVFDGLQTFLGEVSDTATKAADQAPRILPKLETFRDLGKSPLSPEDTKAIAAPIFEGTLTWARDEAGKAVKLSELEAKADGMTADAKAREMLRRGVLTEQVLKMWQGLPVDQYEANVETRYGSQVLKAGVVFTDAELASLFNATPRQVELYREFRAATDTSLHRLAISDMIRFGGKDVEAVREKALSALTARDAALVLRDHLFEAAAAQPQRADVLNDTANRMVDKADQVMDLIERGYAPLSRFGQYTLDVVDTNGDRLYFGLFEGTAERAKMAREMAAAFPGAVIRTGTTSEQEFSMFSGVSPETLELFGGMLGLEAQGDDASSKAFQTYLKVAKASRSAMKRLIERKGTAGFSEDAGRVLAGFIYSNARQTASNLHFAAVMEAATEIPQGQGELKDAALKLINYVKNPQEEAQGFRGLLYAQYLAGSIAGGMLNSTQPLTVTIPYLSQYGGAVKAAKQVARAIKEVAAGKGTGDAGLDAALKKAEDDGIVSPQETHQLMAQAMGRSTLRSGDGTVAGNSLANLQNGFAKLSLAWGKVFSVFEQSNRRITFVAAYRTAVDQGMADPAKFAADAVDATQFVYTKANRPRWSRGAIGGIAFVFKTYGISYVELLHRMWSRGGPEGKKAALLALAILFLMSGADGLPFVDDISDMIDGVLQRMGYNFSSKQARKEFFAEVLGSKEAADFVLKGISGLPGAPIDVSGRLSMSNMIPATGIFLKKTDYSRDLAEIAGPTADLLRRARAAAEKTVQGDILGTEGALVTLLPVAARNIVKGADMAASGMYKDDRGYKVVDTSVAEAAFKAIGFQPRSVDQVQEASWEVQRSKATYILAKSEMQARWAKALFENDPEGVREAREAFDDWNEKNPTQPMRPNMPAIRRRVIEMRKPKEQRVADTAPKAIRQQVREQLREDLR